MKLTDLSNEQHEALITWLKDGFTLSNLQKKITETFSLHLTYMELRLLIDDLDINLEEHDVVKPSNKVGVIDSCDTIETQSPGGVTIVVEKIARPGTMMSGQVTFSDGVNMEWQLDSVGQLGFISTDQTYQPPSEDMPIFQAKLNQAIRNAQGIA